MLGTLLDLPGFAYESSEEVRAEFVAALGTAAGQGADTAYRGSWTPKGPVAGALTSLPIYQSDPIVRRAPALQQTRIAAQPAVAY